MRHFAALRRQSTRHGRGSQERQRRTSDLVVGDEGEAGAKRQRVQNGVAAAGRKGQATQIRAASLGTVSVEVRKEVAKAMQAGSVSWCDGRVTGSDYKFGRFRGYANR